MIIKHLKITVFIYRLMRMVFRQCAKKKAIAGPNTKANKVEAA